MRTRRSGILVASMLGLVAVVGCGPDPKKQIADLQSENARLNDQLKGANDARALAEGNENGARQTIEQLRQQLHDAQARGAAAPSQKNGQWLAMPGFDMISLPGEVLFDSGKNTLRPAGK